jgi:hypothetical protein
MLVDVCAGAVVTAALSDFSAMVEVAMTIVVDSLRTSVASVLMRADDTGVSTTVDVTNSMVVDSLTILVAVFAAEVEDMAVVVPSGWTVEVTTIMVVESLMTVVSAAEAVAITKLSSRVANICPSITEEL